MSPVAPSLTLKSVSSSSSTIYWPPGEDEAEYASTLNTSAPKLRAPALTFTVLSVESACIVVKFSPPSVDFKNLYW